jgi:hypothetical protein
MASQVRKGLLERRGSKAYKAPLERLALKGLLVRTDVTAKLDRLGRLVHKGHKGLAALTEQMALTVRTVWALRAPILPLTGR